MVSTSTTHRQAFRRASAWYKFVALSCFGAGGWVLWQNVELSRLGLRADGWVDANIWPIAIGIAALESAVSIFLTQPENWDDIWANLEGLGGSGEKMPTSVKIALSAFCLLMLLAMCVGAYAFDFYSTHEGLYPGGLISFKTALFTLGYNFGTELLAFFGFQCLRMSKFAERGEIQERSILEPQNRYGRQMLRHRVDMADQRAQFDIQKEREAWARSQGFRGGG